MRFSGNLTSTIGLVFFKMLIEMWSFCGSLREAESFVFLWYCFPSLENIFGDLLQENSLKERESYLEILANSASSSDSLLKHHWCLPLLFVSYTASEEEFIIMEKCVRVLNSCNFWNSSYMGFKKSVFYNICATCSIKYDRMWCSLFPV